MALLPYEHFTVLYSQYKYPNICQWLSRKHNYLSRNMKTIQAYMHGENLNANHMFMKS